MIPNYSQIGLRSFIVFWILRLIQGVAFGFEIGFLINYSNMNFSQENKPLCITLFCFLGDGALVSILFNRLLVDHGMSIQTFDLFWRIQFLLVVCLF